MDTCGKEILVWPTGCDFHTGLVREEARARRYEGAEIPEALFSAIMKLERFTAYPEEQLMEFRRLLADAPQRPDFPFVQPYSLEEIRRERPNRAQRDFTGKIRAAELLDKLHGGWTGRCAGNLVGMPVEGVCASSNESIIDHHGARTGRTKVREYLQAHGEWPLRDYFQPDPAPGPADWFQCPRSFRQNLHFAPTDNDTRYTAINLGILEARGPQFAWIDVARYWYYNIAMGQTCTAENQALLNFSMKMGQFSSREEQAKRINPVWTSAFNNPYREWIGAMIRADGWAFAAAGNPELAAELAWRDACWTHRANGIYGEMFIAALEAAAFVENDWNALVDIALGEIPQHCRLAADVAWLRRTLPSCPDFEACSDALWQYYDQEPIVLTTANCLAVLAALFYAHLEPDCAVCNAVMIGFDTDSAGATAGAIAGIIAGRAQFGGILAERLNDTFDTQVPAFGRITFRELAQRHLAQWTKIVRG